MSAFKFLLLIALLTQICFGDELTTFCQLVFKVNPKTDCFTTASCTDGLMTYDGVSALCKNGHIITLKASGKQLFELPYAINDLVYLESLNIADNNFYTLPPLDGLTALKTIFIHSNMLSNFTGVFVNSPLVNYISASNNKLVELPPELSTMKLKTLLLANNNLSSIPENYTKLTELTNLDLADNDLDCDAIKLQFAHTLFATQCISPQQRTDLKYPPLPLDYSGEPTKAGLDAYEITAIVLFVVFVCLLILFIILYVIYRRKPLAE